MPSRDLPGQQWRNRERVSGWTLRDGGYERLRVCRPVPRGILLSGGIHLSRAVALYPEKPVFLGIPIVGIEHK